MEKQSRIVIRLIKHLEEVEQTLAKMLNEGLWNSSILNISKDTTRSSVNMKSVLIHLVKKTVEGKNCDDDIALIYTENNTKVHEDQPFFQNYINSGEYIQETKKLLNSIPNHQTLINLVLIFHDLLGDILFSICQINSYHMKLSSGILVKDLLKANNHYTSIWELITSNKCNITNSQWTSTQNNATKNAIAFDKRALELHHSLQLCFKEMAKVKLEIEHYFKSNIIEMQFTKPSNGSEMLNNDINREETYKSYIQAKNHNLETTNMFDTKTKTTKMSECFQKSFCNGGTNNSPTNLFQVASKLIESEESDVMFQVPFPNQESLNDWYDQKVFINHPVIYPPDFLFFDPPTVFFQPKVTSFQNHSLPKIYSVDSITEENINPKHTRNSKNKFSKEETSKESSLKKHPQSRNEECFNNKLQIENPLVEDIFSGNLKAHRSDSQLTDLCPELSSLGNMSSTNQSNYAERTIDTTLKIENSDMSCQKVYYEDRRYLMSYLEENEKVESNFNKARPNNEPMYSFGTVSSKMLKLNEIGKRIGNNTEQFKTCNEHYNSNNNRNENTLLDKSEIMYDKCSLIELFRKKGMRNCTNSETDTQEKSSSCMWPVQAEYIHVSSSKQNRCHSVSSSDNSISLSKGFEKSFFSLHLNKRYEHKQLYDGDLIVLEKPVNVQKSERLSYSLINQPFVVLDVDQSKKNKSVKSYKNLCENNNNITQDVDNLLLPFNNDSSQKAKNSIDLHKTIAVQYADCGDSFILKPNPFKRENFDYVKINGLDNNNNWNSFISIFTSKVRQTAQVNHKMFRKIINYGSESMSGNPLFNNVHTLTSNGGPFRLFDLNGYPLTDSAGNVLKDPYGKSVVQLDSTGFPKNDVKVFDAAGNSFKDLNFDPTQKPKTNTIIIKLTDNFKRPLHLFDKYGRPLTDSYGKLLINVHGRPLLRFDNFGRPNTDYRGGPLYTDNGFQWSYKNGETLSTEQLSNQTITTRKLSGCLKNKLMENSCNPIELAESNPKMVQKMSAQCGIYDDKTITLHNCNSDIWTKVENILQQLPNKKHKEPRASQTNVIVNNVSVTRNPFEKELLEPIIYHNSIIHQNHNDKSLNSNLCNNNSVLHNSKGIENKLVQENILLRKKIEGMRNEFFQDNLAKMNVELLSSNPARPTYFPLYNNKQIKNNSSKCSFQYQIPNETTVGRDKYLKHPLLPVKENFLLQNNRQRNNNRITPSCLTFKKYNYLNNLCDRILKNQIGHQGNTTFHTNLMATNRLVNDWTNTSLTRFTGSDSSKYSTELPCTDLLAAFTDSPKESSQTDVRTASEEICHSQKQNLYQKFFMNKQYFQDKISSSSDCTTKTEIFKNKMKIKKNSKDNKTNGKCYENCLQSLSTVMSPSVLNQSDKHHEFNVAENVAREIKLKNVPSIFHQNLFLNNLKDSEIIKNGTYPALNVETNNNYKKCYDSNKRVNMDSPFHFNSVNSIVMDDNKVEIKYDHEKNCNISSTLSFKKDCVSQNNKHPYSIKSNTNLQKYENTRQKGTKIYNDLEKSATKRYAENSPNSRDKRFPEQGNKPIVRKGMNLTKKQLPNRECTLVSFLGSQVKYVLNKLDNRISSKPNKYTDTSLKKDMDTNLMKKTPSKENTTGLNTQSKITEDCKVKKMYESTEVKVSLIHQKGENKNEIGQLSLNKKRELIAFQSKSCLGLGNVNEDTMSTMSFSGNENNSQNDILEKKLSHNILHRKCSSAVTSVTWDTIKDPLKRSRKPEPISHNKHTYFDHLPTWNWKKSHRSHRKTSKGHQKQNDDEHKKSLSAPSKNKVKDKRILEKLKPKMNSPKIKLK